MPRPDFKADVKSEEDKKFSMFLGAMMRIPRRVRDSGRFDEATIAFSEHLFSAVQTGGPCSCTFTFKSNRNTEKRNEELYLKLAWKYDRALKWVAARKNKRLWLFWAVREGACGFGAVVVIGKITKVQKRMFERHSKRMKELYKLLPERGVHLHDYYMGLSDASVLGPGALYLGRAEIVD